MNKLLDDITTLTSLPKNISKDLIPIMENAIAHRVFETVRNDADITQVDIGVGLLYIKSEGTQVKYRFIPSKKLEEEVAKVLVTRESPLEKKLEQSLLEKMESAYKGML